MRRLIVSIVFVAIASLSMGQVFNTGQTLKPKAFSIGFEPGVMINGNTDFIMFIHGGMGLVKGVDFAAHVGVLGPQDYFGADVEFALPARMSITAGAHHFGDFGLDGTFNITFPIRSGIRFSTGADLDVNFNDDKTRFLLWLPLGMEIGLRKNMSFIFEAEVGLTDPAYHFIGGGINIYI